MSKHFIQDHLTNKLSTLALRAMSALSLMSLTVACDVDDQTEEVDLPVTECTEDLDCPNVLGGTFCEDNKVMEMLETQLICEEGRCGGGAEPRLVEDCGESAACELSGGEAVCVPTVEPECTEDLDCPSVFGGTFCEDNKVMEMLETQLICEEGRCGGGVEPRLIEECGEGTACDLYRGEAFCIPLVPNPMFCQVETDCESVSGAISDCDGDSAILSYPETTCQLISERDGAPGLCNYEEVVESTDCAEQGLSCVGGQCVEAP